MAAVFLSMQNVSKRYTGVRALDGVDFEIRKGEIHCLMGENGSGKSTLIKIISGVVHPDEGSRIEVEGRILANHHSIDSIRRGVEVIYQDLALFPNLSVAENISFLQTVAEANLLMKWRKAGRIAEQSMARIGVRIPLDAPVGELSIADQQLVAICRALTSDVKLLIMDEPTTALTRKEVEALFTVVRDLQSKGIATLFISHKLGEVLQIADRLTVLRDGRKIGTFERGELTEAKLTFLMTGKTVSYTPYVPRLTDAAPLLEVRNLRKKDNFSGISFSLRAGEILGITGLLGSGRTELALALFGVNPPDGGELLIEGRKARIRSVQDAIRHAIGYVPENRMLQGLVMEQSVGRNLVVTVIEKLRGRLKLIDVRARDETIDRWLRDLAIRAPSPSSPVQTLSGGNQQRVVLAKWLATSPRILILDGPTVGIDVAAKSSIHEIIRELAGRGMGIIVISDEVPEVLHTCNRILVMRHGRIAAEFEAGKTNEEEIQQRINEHEEAATVS
jgi:simple sugar transport system ATP-binding protein